MASLSSYSRSLLKKGHVQPRISAWMFQDKFQAVGQSNGTRTFSWMCFVFVVFFPDCIMGFITTFHHLGKYSLLLLMEEIRLTS